MSEQRAVDAIVGKPPTSGEIFSDLDRATKLARIAYVMDRGITNDRLHVPDMPAHLHYEFAPNDPSEISRLASLGFWVPTANELGVKSRSLHGDGSNSIIVGDAVLVVCTKDDYKLIELVREQRFKIANGDPSIRRRKHQQGDAPKGETAAQDEVIKTSTVIDESVEESIGGEELASRIASMVPSKKT